MQPRARTRPPQHDHRRATPEPAVGRGTSTRGRANQRGKRHQHEALRLSVWRSVLVFSGCGAVSDCMRRMRRRSGHGAKDAHRDGAARRRPRNTRASRRPGDVHERACDAARHTRRQRDALRPSVCKSVLVLRGSDAMSDFFRRMRRHADHAAKNSHSTGTAGSQTCNARASRRPCDVHERACDAARKMPSA